MNVKIRAARDTAALALAVLGFSQGLMPPPSQAAPTPGEPAPRWGERPTYLWDDPQLVVEATGLATVPAGRLGELARAAGGGGAAFGARWTLRPSFGLRATLGWNTVALGSRPQDRRAVLSLHPVRLRVDATYTARWWRPYVGLGVSVVPWGGHVREVSSGQENRANLGVAAGGTLAAGIDLNLVQHLSVAPEGGWTFVGGDFRAAIWQAGLALRWEI